jgi:hypothetical protein
MVVGIALGLMLVCGSTWAGVEGPVVGFVRLEVGPGTQRVEPTVRPWAPQTEQGETAGQALSDYLGEGFRSGTDASSIQNGASLADRIGFVSEQDGEVMLLWRDQQGQWRDLAGEAVEPPLVGADGFWLDLVFEAEESDGIQTRELVLSGEAVWEEGI